MQESWEYLDEFIPKMQAAWGVPGLGIAIVQGDQTVYSRGFGVLAQGGESRTDAHSIFAIGSCTKAFTAAAVGILVQEGHLNWDDPVIQYLPDFQLFDPVATREITIRDLLCHRCGLATFSGDFMGYGSIYSPEEALARARFIPPAFHLRTAYGYSNIMFTAAGLVIEKVSGQAWAHFIQQRLLKPLGMERTTTSSLDLRGLQNVSQPHSSRGGQLFQVPYAHLKAHAASGAINASAWDMALWLRFQLADGLARGNQLVEPFILHEMRIPHTLMPIDKENRMLILNRHFLAYGLGWDLNDYAGRLVIHHTGGVDGMLSLAAFLPEEQFGVVILTNKLPGSLHQALFLEILDTSLGLAKTDWQAAFLGKEEKETERTSQLRIQLEKDRRKGSRPSLELESYTGVFENPIYGDMEVVLESSRLFLHPSAHPNMIGPLEHWHADTFCCVWSNPSYEESFVHFTVGLDGKADNLRFKVAEFIDPLEYSFARKK